MHPGWQRCSSLKYSRYSRSSRLASRAPRPPRCDAGVPPRAASGGARSASALAQVGAGGSARPIADGMGFGPSDPPEMKLVLGLSLLAVVALDLARPYAGRSLRPWQFAAGLLAVAAFWSWLRSRGVPRRDGWPLGLLGL